MTLAPWRSLITRALHKNRSLVYARYLQLATVRENGLPANRTVVFRGFLENTNQLKFITDLRSAKAEQISNQPAAEICWYFPNSREQFRIGGKLNLVTVETDSHLQTARTKMWQEISDSGRLQFVWPEPGEEREKNPAAFTPPAPDPLQPVDNFCLLLLEPTELDHLELRGEPQNRTFYKLDQNQQWYSQEVNP
jgi:PPOX class probable FMN-dependent enzyme